MPRQSFEIEGSARSLSQADTILSIQHPPTSRCWTLFSGERQGRSELVLRNCIARSGRLDPMCCGSNLTCEQPVLRWLRPKLCSEYADRLPSRRKLSSPFESRWAELKSLHAGFYRAQNVPMC